MDPHISSPSSSTLISAQTSNIRRRHRIQHEPPPHHIVEVVPTTEPHRHNPSPSRPLKKPPSKPPPHHNVEFVSTTEPEPHRLNPSPPRPLKKQAVPTPPESPHPTSPRVTENESTPETPRNHHVRLSLPPLVALLLLSLWFSPFLNSGQNHLPISQSPNFNPRTPNIPNPRDGEVNSPSPPTLSLPPTPPEPPSPPSPPPPPESQPPRPPRTGARLALLFVMMASVLVFSLTLSKSESVLDLSMKINAFSHGCFYTAASMLLTLALIPGKFSSWRGIFSYIMLVAFSIAAIVAFYYCPGQDSSFSVQMPPYGVASFVTAVICVVLMIISSS